ncbi:MAG: hypothetical protein AMS19_04600 [Gemmatimonas sp. SG8_23]|jgi:hypothetical protein|nr:MAG: hypothetical protein AMS19_04600 [Gemmatimonas sp. SG8_23]
MDDEAADASGAAVPAGRGRPERRFGDPEIAQILQKAAELQERSPGGGPEPGRGLTLEELRQVAREAGIDPAFVDLAARTLETPVARRGDTVAGGPTRWHLSTTIDGEIAERDLEGLLQVIRSTLHAKGDVGEVWGRVEWSHDDGLGPTIVGLSSRDGSTQIDVSSVRSSEAGLIHGMIIPFGSLLGTAALADVVGVSGSGTIFLMVAMAGLVYAGTRFAWGLRSRWWERRLRSVMERLTATVHDVARLPPGEEPGG